MNNPKLTSLGELVDMELPQRVYLLGGWLTVGSVNMVHAWRGRGKTFFGLSVAYAVASGSKFLGWDAPKRAMRVLYVDGEMGKKNLQERVELMELSRLFSEPADHMIQFLTFEDCPGEVIYNLADPAMQGIYSKALESCQVAIIDNISTCVRPIGRQTEVEAWAAVQTWAIRERLKGKSIIFIHHSGKTGTQRGTSRTEDCMDAVINLKTPLDYNAKKGLNFELHFEKARHFHGKDAEGLFVSLERNDDGTFWWKHSPLEEFELETVSSLREQGESLQSVSKKTGISVAQLKRMWGEDDDSTF